MEPTIDHDTPHTELTPTPLAAPAPAQPEEQKGAIGIALVVWLLGGGLGLAVLVFLLAKMF